MLTYLMTNNESVAARLAVPRTRYLLDSVTPTQGAADQL